MASKEIVRSFGGLQVRNLKEIDVNFLCQLCKLLQLHPMQLLCCGTRLCGWCSTKGVPDSEPFVCPFCQRKQTKKQAQADRGVERELNIINIECCSCSWNGSYQDYQEHLQQNHVDLECCDCHARFFAINSHEEHRQEVCEYRRIPCGLPGCEQLVAASNMTAHYLSVEHQKSLYVLINPYTIRMKEMTKNWICAISMSNIRTNMGYESMANEESTTLPSPRTARQENSDAENRVFFACVQSQTAMDEQLGNTTMFLLDAESSITFPFREQRAGIDSLSSMYSPTFRTATFGYFFKIRVSSIIRVDRVYLSIYITLLRSDFDPILAYPFSYDISLCLCDQSGQGRHIVSMIKPSSNRSAFTRPTSEKNMEIGATEFCLLNDLIATDSIYLKDGVFSIRISFDFMNRESRSFR